MMYAFFSVNVVKFYDHHPFSISLRMGWDYEWLMMV